MKLIVLSTENKTRTENVSVFWFSIFFTVAAAPSSPQMVVVR